MGNRIVYAYVVGDLWHIGHKRFLQQAKALGNYLIVGVLTDEAVIAYKREPIIPYEERIELIADSKQVDEVIRQDDVNPTENLKKIKPDILVHAHYLNENPIHWQQGCAYMESIGKQSIRLNYYPGQSTTQIIERIKNLFDSNK